MTANVAIMNVTGYAGAELARLLYAHPQVKIAAITGRSAAGKQLPEVFPHLFPLDLPIVESVSPDDRRPTTDDRLDLVFSCMPPAAAAEPLLPFIEAGVPVVDLSADFRLRRVEDYEAAYKTKHPAPHLLPDAVFGLPELHRDAIRASKLVAVSGCHSAGVILALAPLFASGLIEPNVIADTKTGLSGAGRALDQKMHFSEADENVGPYGLDGHRHVPEMVQELSSVVSRQSSVAGACVRVTFVPHYIPMTRGILSTCYADALPGKSIDREGLLSLYRDYYREAPFVHVADAAPSTKHTAGTNYCIVHPTLHGTTGKIVVTSALDNLGKGAAGTMVQCMNLMLGFDETAGLRTLGVFP